MADATRDPWAQKWKLHRDRRGIFKGVQNLEFELIPMSSGTNFKIYKFDHQFDNGGDERAIDPFLNTQFVQFGNAFPSSPDTKLVEWKPDFDVEETYQALIGKTFDFASANFFQLIGEKEVDGKKEMIVLRLIPEAIDIKTGTPKTVDLIHAQVKTHMRFTMELLQDGTAHGNPR